MKLLLLIVIFQVTRMNGEMVEIPNLALYQVTPESETHLHFLHLRRLRDSGWTFINGIGQLGETVDIIAAPEAMESFDKNFDTIQLQYDMQFRPVTIEMYNNKSTTTQKPIPKGGGAVLLPEASPPPVQRKFMEIEPMTPSIFSGIFLNIFSASHPDLEELSIGNSKMNSSMGNPFLCLSMEKHTKRTEHDGRKQWIFEKSEREGYYVLRNRKLTTGFATWEDDDEQFLVLEMRREFQRQYKKGGKLRANALFKITPNTQFPEKGEVYEIAVLGMDGDDLNLLADSRFKEQSGCYVLKRGGKSQSANNTNHLFKIHRGPGTLRLIAHLEDFKYPVTTEELYQKATEQGTVKPLTTRKVNNHNSHTLKLEVEDVHERLDKFHIKFNKPLNAFDAVWVPPGLSIGTPVTVLDPRHQNGIHAAVKLNTMKDAENKEKDTVAKIKYLITGGIQIPPHSSVEYAVVFGWLNRLEQTFEASLRITAKADRMTQGGVPKPVPDQLVPFSLAKEILKERHFHLHEFPAMPSESEMWAEVPINGTVVGWSIGIKGEIQITVNQLSNKNVTFACHDENENT
ncbi:unnamed protein product [Orchesella dallaii]|uniref:Uncharacterized protein n=1 Tax=Orchesella dallaii TaxID=48710 RepID=A0ABP1QYE1_9HEXA